MKATPWNAVALSISGDLGGLTYYQDRYRRVIAFPKSPPQQPATTMQLQHRAHWSLAVQAWREQTPQIRAAWERASLRLSLMMTGHNMWIHFAFSQDADLLATVNQQSNESLQMPPDPRA